MAGGLPPRQDPNQESHYATAEEEERARAYHEQRAHMASTGITLPSIQDAGHPAGRPWGPDPRDPRASVYGPSPAMTNAYAPPPPGATPGPPRASLYSPHTASNPYPAPPGQHYMPPGPPPEARVPYAAQDPRAQPPGYYQGQRPPSYPNNAYDYAYRPERGHPFPGGPAAAAMMQPQAPRQRTSIACRYCRRRKIRCSGYQQSPGGKCTNCIKMNQECIFQPVSSSSSTAFVPVSALQNGIPPGTQLFGAYGQPIAPPGTAPPPGHYPGPPPPGGAAPPQYEQPLPSPTGSFGSFSDERSDSGRRRQREEEHGVRLPPPVGYHDEGSSQRRSPSGGSPGHLQPIHHLPQPGPPPGYDSRTPPPAHRNSPPGAPSSGPSASSVMSLGNIMDSSTSDYDRGMLGKLNRRNP